jgi:putative flippase GtrA
LPILEFLRFLCVGLACLAIDVFLLLALADFMDFLIANLVATIVSTSIAFFLHLYFTFDGKGAERLSMTASRFLGVTLLLWLVNYLISSLLIWSDSRNFVLIMLSKTAVVLSIGALRFILLKGFVFK